MIATTKETTREPQTVRETQTHTVKEPRASRVPTPLAKRVLVVEDDPNGRWVLCALLRRLGFECQTAVDGIDALAKVKTFAPQVILMDLMMPRLDGLEATRRLKADARTRGIPVLAVTGIVTPSGETAARQAGCDDFLGKPIVFQDLLARLNQHLGA